MNELSTWKNKDGTGSTPQLPSPSITSSDKYLQKISMTSEVIVD